MPYHYIRTFRGNSQQQQTPGKARSALSFQAREDHYPSDGVTFPSGTAHPTLFSFHCSSGFSVDKDPHATGNLGTKPSLDTPRVSNLILVLQYGGPQNTLGQKRGNREAEGWGPSGLAPTHGFSPKHPWDQTAVMSDSFRAAEFTRHLSG